MISFQNVTFRYGSRVILKDVSFTAQPGTCTVLAGPNGIGKSTALALAAGALRPRSGKIIREGKLGYAPQEAAVLPDLNAKDNLRFFAGLCRAPLPENPFLPLEGAGRKRAGKLSGGMQKRLSLVCADLGSPENLLLDEPCIGLDVNAQSLLFEQIVRWKAEGRCILYAGHNAAELESVCDRLVLLGEGEYQVLDRTEIPDFGAVLTQWLTPAGVEG